VPLARTSEFLVTGTTYIGTLHDPPAAMNQGHFKGGMMSFYLGING
jgi:hypothetical protein